MLYIVVANFKTGKIRITNQKIIVKTNIRKEPYKNKEFTLIKYKLYKNRNKTFIIFLYGILYRSIIRNDQNEKCKSAKFDLTRETIERLSVPGSGATFLVVSPLPF